MSAGRPRLGGGLCAALLVLLPVGAAVAAGAPTAVLRPNGAAVAGKDMDLLLDVTWDGRPERLAPGLPEVTLPAGASLRPTHTGSTFDGEHTTWRWEAVLRLPEEAGPWIVGPATVPAREEAGAAVRVKADAIRLRPSTARMGAQLVGQGLGSALSIVVVSLFARWMWKRTSAAPDLVAKDSLPGLRAAAERAVGAGGVPAWEALVALRRALGAAGMEHLPIPPLSELEQALDAVRYGGEGAAVLVCSSVLQSLSAAVTVASGRRN